MPRPNAKKFKFGEWLPDQPDLDNPGLTEALNVRVVAGNYQPYFPLATTGPAFTATSAVGAVALAVNNIAAAVRQLYVGTAQGKIYGTILPVISWGDVTGGTASFISDLCQYDTLMFAAIGAGAGNILVQTGLSGNFAAISGSPQCSVLGVIGQFLLAGNIHNPPSAATPQMVQWSAIANPTSWPTPGSAAAIAAQAGEQLLHEAYGSVTGIFGADQWGVITQPGAITRVNYVGGTDVFQFDTLASGIGMDFPHLGIKVGAYIYFASSKGFYSTDGVSVNPFGDGKVNLWFIANVVATNMLFNGSATVDWTNKVITWAFVASGGGTAILVHYNMLSKRFTHSSDVNVAIMVPGDEADFETNGLIGIGQNFKYGTFTGTPGTATLTSSEVELNPGGKTLVQGFRPQVTGTTSVTCRIGYRMQESDAITYTGALTLNSKTGFADCLIESGYHRAETDITGNFIEALGGEFLSDPAGAY